MIYHGIDLIEVARITHASTRWGDRFLTRVFTSTECERYRNRPESLAARFAAKEAVAKLLGVGIRGLGADRIEGAVEWTEIELLNDPHGKPLLHLHGRAAARATALHLHDLAVSISHSRGLAIASVVAIAAPPESAD
jgi:holo-[acyl-carrier protein] synthase